MNTGRHASGYPSPSDTQLSNLMPVKGRYGAYSFLRSLSNTPLQVDVTFRCSGSAMSPRIHHTSHLNKFYVTFQDVKNQQI